MVTVVLKGGMGNQMFQYALGLNLAKRNGTELLLDTVFLDDRFPRRNFTYRNFNLDVFALMPRFTVLSRTAKKLPVPGAWLGLDLGWMELNGRLGRHKIVREKEEHAFDPRVLSEKGEVVLWGHWQNPGYFPAEEDVRRAFGFRHPLTGEALEFAERIKSSNSVSLNIRRGDYAAFANVKALMGETDVSYFSRAAEHVAARVANPEFFIFSDDIEWCKANLRLPFPMTFIPQSAAGPKWSHYLELMTLCRHNVIANSTFSWWGAWLNRNPGKIVVAPARWYADPGRSDHDLVPPEWVRL